MAVSFYVVILILFLISVDNYSVKAKKIILKKCCPFKSYINESLETLEKSCDEVDSNNNLNYDDLKVYDSDLHLTGRSVKDVFELNATGPFNLDEAFDYNNSMFGVNMWLVETGLLYMEFPNEWERWKKLNNSDFCVDYLVAEGKLPTPHIWAILPTLPSEESGRAPYILTVPYLISCVFLALVLVVYMLVSELRNLKGLILMAFVATLLTAFSLHAVMSLLRTWNYLGCQLMTYFIYYSFLASFCWMNVMSFDIWRTFRQENSVRFMFRNYSAYAFGVPLAMTAFFVTVNHVPMRHLPWFVTPKVPKKACFIGGTEKLLYLYVPMLILILLNWMFFLMTALELRSHHRRTRVLDTHGAGPTPAHRQHRARYLRYLKLSVIMGISWILEVGSSFAPHLAIWIVTDLYNVLAGLSIFLIFVCNRSTLGKLMKRIQTIRGGTSFASVGFHSGHTTSSDASQEATVEVCLHPDGTSKHG